MERQGEKDRNAGKIIIINATKQYYSLIINLENYYLLLKQTRVNRMADLYAIRAFIGLPFSLTQNIINQSFFIARVTLFN